MSRWFRFYDDALDNPKAQRLPPVLFKAWVNLLCLASRNGGLLPCVDDMAFALRTDADTMAGWLADLIAKGLIDADDDGAKPHNWHTRQFSSDADATAAERKRRQRARDKEASSQNVTDNVTRDMSVSSHPPEADTEAETEAHTARGPAGLPDGETLRLQKAIAQAYAKAGSLPPAMHRVTVWLDAGYTPDEIESVVLATLECGKAPRSLNYFDGPIADARKAVPKAEGQAPAPKMTLDQQIKANLAKMTPDDWRKYVRGWQSGGSWPPAWGYPDEARTPVPDAILIEFGVKNPRLTGPPHAPIGQKRGRDARH